MNSTLLPQVGTEREGTPPQLTRYAWLSIGVAILTILIKTTAYLVTGSVGLLSDATESLVNLAAAIVALIALKVACRPADDNHHYGHGKAEYFSAGFEGLMIFVAASAILVTAVERFLHPAPIESAGLGLAISTLGSALNGVTAVILLRAGRAHRSATLIADGKHLMTDVWTSAGVVLGVLLVAITGWQRLDPLVAAAMGLNILVTGFRLIAQSTVALLDVALSPEDDARLRAVLAGYHDGQIAVSDIRTRQSGQQRFVSLTLLVPGEWTVHRAHDLADEVEAAIAQELPGVAVQTHLEPAHPPTTGDHGVRCGGRQVMDSTVSNVSS
ncbi:MAG TPA: cation diffusion facilitator family transporter [Kineosporiaceae bacterium]